MTDRDPATTTPEPPIGPREADDLFGKAKSIEEQLEALHVERDALADDDFAAKLDHRERIRDLELELSEIRARAHDLTGDSTPDQDTTNA
jgi:hypothetical protein